LAHALSSLLPPLGEREAGEVRDVYALAGLGSLLPSRPFHAFGSAVGLPPLLRDRRFAGVEEVLLAHHGVLYLDQACEREPHLFPALLQPMLHGHLLARVRERRVEVPADVVVVASHPRCGCGGQGDPWLACTCRPTEARRYQARGRRLLRYPFDLCVPLAPERGKGGSPAEARVAAARVEAARARMRRRCGTWNARLGEPEVFEALPWRPQALRLWEALESRAPGRRQAYVAVARVALTVCDLREGEEVGESDLLEALHYFPGAGEGGAGSRLERHSVPAVNSSAIP
jgi:magnesium chelatase family protein